MRHTVIWHQVALDKLADLWAASSDRNSVTKAVEQIDRLLAENPVQQGEEYYGDRLVVVASIAFTYQVLEDDRIAEIIDVFAR